MEKDFLKINCRCVFPQSLVLVRVNSKACKQHKAKENKDMAQKQSFNMILLEKGLTLPVKA